MAEYSAIIKSSVYNGSTVSGGGYNQALQDVIKDIESLNNNKADKTELATLKTTVDANTHSVDTLMTLKANQRDLDALEANKADKTELDNLKSSALIQYPQQTNHEDLNTLINPGAYLLWGFGGTYPNHPIPNGIQTGMLIVTKASGMVYQHFHSETGRIYIRTGEIKWTNSWSDWCTTTAESIGATTVSEFNQHINDNNLHVSSAERQDWNSNIRKTDALMKLTQGIVWDFEEDDSSGNKIVPTGAKAASVTKVGAKSLVWNQLLVPNTTTSSEVDSKTYIDLYIRMVSGTNVPIGRITKTGRTLLAFQQTEDDRIYRFYHNGSQHNITLYETYPYASLIGGHKYIISLDVIDLNLSEAKTHVKNTTMLFDLTQMFGTGNEPTVQVFEQMLPAEFYEQCAPVLRNYEPKKVLCIGAEEFVEKTINLSAVIEKYFPDGMKSVGDVYDEIDFEIGKAIKRIGAVRLGDIPSWGSVSTSSTVSANRYKTDHIKDVIKLPSGNSTKANIICDGFETVTAGDTWYGVNGICADSSGSIFIFDGTSDVNAFKQRVAGFTLYYELAEPVITDITETLDHELIVETGDKLMLESAYPDTYVPLPNTVKYMVKLSEVS